MNHAILLVATLGLVLTCPLAHAEQPAKEVAETDLAVQAGPAVFSGIKDGGMSLGGDILVRHGYFTAGLVAEAGGAMHWFGHSFTGIFAAAGGCLHWPYFRTNALLLLGGTQYSNRESKVPEDMRSGTVASIGGRMSALFVIPLGRDNPTGLTLGPVMEYVIDSDTKSAKVVDLTQGESGNAVIGDRRWRLGVELGLVWDL